MASYTRQTVEKNTRTSNHRLSCIRHKANRAAFTAYIEKRRASALVDSGTHVADADEFYRFASWLGNRAITALKPSDMVAFFATQMDKAKSTRYKSYVVLKRFFREFHGLEDGETPPEFKGFKMKRPPKSTVRVEQLLTPEEFQRMLRFCRTKMERAMLSILYEAGPRASELLSIDIQHVQRDEFGYKLTIPDVEGNKTGGRRIRVHLAALQLQEWLSEHKLADRPEAPLFYGTSNRRPYQRWGYGSLAAFVRRLRREAGVTKHVWCHLFRHTAATESVRRGLVGPALCRQMGWTDDTDMQAIYVHLSQNDVDSQVLASGGVKPEGPGVRSGLQPRVCTACGARNLPDAIFCRTPGCGDKLG